MVKMKFINYIDTIRIIKVFLFPGNYLIGFQKIKVPVTRLDLIIYFPLVVSFYVTYLIYIIFLGLGIIKLIEWFMEDLR